MTDLEAYERKARQWLDSMAATYGAAARKGLAEAQDLALSRSYLAARHDAGFGGIHWKPEFGGQGLGYLEKLTFDRAEAEYGMPTGYFGVSLAMPLPIIQRYGSDAEWVRTRSLNALRGEEIWCQLFSEPSGGSDLAGLRTKAVRDGDGWRITGQKLWTTWAQHSDYGLIVVRTDPDLPKHKGLTCFWVDMRAPGVTVRPVKLADGSAHVNEVWFDEVAVADRQRLGEMNGGFAVAMATLMIERYAASDSAGFGPHLDLFIETARQCEIAGRPALEDGRIRSAIARNHAMRCGLDAISARAFQALQAGREPGPEGALGKLVSVRSRQKLSELALDVMGGTGVGWNPRASVKEDWAASWLDAPTGRLAGGADEMLLNTIAERVLGLPQDHRPDKGVPFNRIPV